MTADDLIRAELAADLLRESPRQLIPEFTSAQVALLNPADFPKAEILCTLFGGIRLRSNAIKWRPISSVLRLSQQHTDFTVGSTTTETPAHSVEVPGWLIDVNDTFELHYQCSRTASANSDRVRFRLGGTGIDGDLVAERIESSATAVTMNYYMSASCRNSSSSQLGTVSSSIVSSSAANPKTTANLAGGITLWATLMKGVSGNSLVGERFEFRMIRGAGAA